VTDSGTEIRVGEDKPALTNLVTMFSVAVGEPPEAIVERYAGRGYGDFKNDLGEALGVALAPIRTRYEDLMADPAELDRLMGTGAERASEVADRTLAQVRERIGLPARSGVKPLVQRGL
ncbi:MAG: tryptophan--tRNA ligase, partial [Actinomycetota bacterium]|nr:tryptophan--tRNA ligase [Actinomycetota bacterium]